MEFYYHCDFSFFLDQSLIQRGYQRYIERSLGFCSEDNFNTPYTNEQINRPPRTGTVLSFPSYGNFSPIYLPLPFSVC